MCCNKRRERKAARQQALVSATGTIAQMGQAINTNRSTQNNSQHHDYTAFQTSRAPPTPQTLPPPYSSHEGVQPSQQPTPFAKDLAPNMSEEKSTLPSAPSPNPRPAFSHAAPPHSIAADEGTFHSTTAQANTPQGAAAYGTPPTQPGEFAGGFYIPYSVLDGKLAEKLRKKCAKWHQKRCVEEGCWCRGSK